MNIVILAGGTGSIQLQNGMYRALEEGLDGVDTKIIVNAYDNGLSTGAVRAVMGGRILGPSDVRKNQTTRLRMMDSSSPWLAFMEHRFSCEAAAAFDTCIGEAKRLSQALGRRDVFDLMTNAVGEYFSFPLAMAVKYQDFALANIVYAGLAASNSFSLRAAARVMATAIGMADNVLLNDDTPLFLGAITKRGSRICDEGQIVAWDRADDPFAEIFFTDHDGKQTSPELCMEAWRAILDADLVILSAGTQWSSLIPTYASGGFKEAIAESKATVIMIMNRAPDRDSPGQTASELIEFLIPKYFDSGRLHVLTDRDSHPNFQQLDRGARGKVASFTVGDLSGPGTPSKQHDPTKLADAVARVYFGDYIQSDVFVFDYDDTLCTRNGSQLQRTNRANANGISRLNTLTKVAICTGNAVNAVDLRADVADGQKNNQARLHVFADGGINEYLLHPDMNASSDRSGLNPNKCISPDALLAESGPHSAQRLVLSLQRAGIPRKLISVRGNALIAIRPVESRDRAAVLALARRIVGGSGLQVRETGTTTVEICKPSLSKVFAVRHLFSPSTCLPRITYVGDELECGNDQDIRNLSRESSQIKCLHVRSPAKTAYFIQTLTSHLNGQPRN